MPIRSALSEIKRAPEACGHGWVSPNGRCVQCGTWTKPATEGDVTAAMRGTDVDVAQALVGYWCAPALPCSNTIPTDSEGAE